MSEYADPDLETVAPLPPLPPFPGAPDEPPAGGRGPIAAIVAGLVIVSLIVGFGVATIVLNARDSGSDDAATPVGPTTPATLLPGTNAPGISVPGTTAPRVTVPGRTVPADPDESVLGSLIVGQSDVAAGDTVGLLQNGADLSVATLDLCNGTFASESQRSARRQVGLVDGQGDVVLSTEAILYRTPAGGAQAFAQLRSVAAHCPSTPVKSPVGEDTATTTFRPAPDGAWARTASVERLAYDFVTSGASGDQTHSIAVYLRRGRALMGVYFDQPDGAQEAVAGQTTVAGIVGVFEARMAKLPADVVSG